MNKRLYSSLLLISAFCLTACENKKTQNNLPPIDYDTVNLLDRSTFLQITDEALIKGNIKAFEKICWYFWHIDRIDEVFFYWFVFASRYPSKYAYSVLDANLSFGFIDEEHDYVIKTWGTFFDLKGATIGSERSIRRLEQLSTKCRCEPRNVAYILTELAKQDEGNKARVKVYIDMGHYYNLLERAKKLGDTAAYNEARRYAFQKNITNEFFHVSFVVACRYNYGEAYYDLYSKIKSISRVDSSDATLDDFAQYWLVKALEAGTTRSSKKARDFYSSDYYLLKIMENLYK